MTDGGLIEGSAPAGDSGAEYATVLDAGAADTGGTALVYDAGSAEYISSTVYEEPVYDPAYDEAAFYTEPTASSEIAFGDTGSGGRTGCTAGACPHPMAHPAEADWEQLVSAVPVEGQLGRFKPRCEGMSYPTEDDFRSAVAAVRPLDPDSFSLQRLRTGWTEEVAAVLADWPGLLRTNLAALAAGWAGADFDAFNEQADQVKTLVQGVLDDIEDTAAELKNREEALYALQGGDSGEIPYPAPLVGAEGEWTSLVAIHVRPAWWHGDCIRMGCEEAEQALRLGGADPALAAEVRAFVEERAGAGTADAAVEGAVPSEARLQAGEEAKTAFGPRIDAAVAEYAERHAAIDGAIGEKLGGQSEQLAAMTATGADRPYPDSADASYMDLASPVMEQPAAPVAPQATQDPSPVPPSGDGSVRTEAETSTAPAEAAADGTVSGGLASGGGFGGFGGASVGGGAVVPGGAATAVAGGGPGFTGTAPGVFGPGPAAGPTASGSGSGPGVSAARTSVVGGRAAADARKKGERSEEDEEPEDDDLLFRETGNVWGYVRPGDDPYS
ncbi:hypothetical protein [Glycomyces sp. MUSA5-2]|uniref:hypothetical protein n=1 Tax=Glycomyces sp. MUSA5-2 TaxID=2053002 RepID=UPI003008B106